MESFWARMKTKIGIPFLFDDVYDAKAEIYNYVHIYYNRQRMHSAIGYMSLVRFEEQILSKQRDNLSSQLQPRKISLIPATETRNRHDDKSPYASKAHGLTVFMGSESDPFYFKTCPLIQTNAE